MKRKVENKKTGMAGRMRAWMKEQRKSFSPRDIADGIGLPLGRERDYLRNAIADFLTRGEVVRVAPGRYSYCHGWRRNEDAPLREKVLKAMYVSVTEFRVADLVRLSGAGRNYVQKLVRKLKKQGYLGFLGKGERDQHFYRVDDRQRFRRELMP